MMNQLEAPKPAITDHIARNPSDLAVRVVELAQKRLARSLAIRGHASLVVSGGQALRRVLPALSQMPIAWERVTVHLADECWVPHDSPESHQHLVRETLMQGPAARASLCPLVLSDLSREQACLVHDMAFARDALPFDVVLLGVGEDGHVASIFPGVPGAMLRGEESKLFVPVMAPVAPHERISMSPRLLLQSRSIVLVFQGDQRRGVYRRALLERSPFFMPVAALMARAGEAELHVAWSPS